MFSKNEAKLLRQEFWTSFGKSFPQNGFYITPMSKGLVLNFILIQNPLMLHFVLIWSFLNNKFIGIN